MIIAIFLVILLPFGIFFYESDPEKNFVLIQLVIIKYLRDKEWFILS